MSSIEPKCSYQPRRIIAPECVFSVPLDELIVCEGRYYCKYHAPLTAKQSHYGVDDFSQLFYRDLKRACAREPFTTQFGVTLYFDGVVFPTGIDSSLLGKMAGGAFDLITLDRAVIHGNLDLSPSFPHDLVLSEAYVAGDVRARIEDGACIASDVVILGSLALRGSRFAGPVVLARAQCHGSMDLSHCTYQRDFVLEGYSIYEPTPDGRDHNFSFAEAVFHSGADFSESIFEVPVTFEGTQFYGKANFGASRFADVSFREARFHDEEESREDVSLIRDSGFVGCCFNGLSLFSGATFSGPVSFRGAVFKGPCEFTEARFARDVTFEGQGTPGPDRVGRVDDGRRFPRARFQGTRFGGHLDLSGREFFDLVDLSNVELHRCPNIAASVFHGGLLMDVNGFAPVASRQEYHAIRGLRTVMESQGLHREACLLFKMEQGGQGRFGGLQFANRLLLYAYGVLSDYGTRFVTPLLWLVLIQLAYIALMAGGLRAYCPKVRPDLAEIGLFALYGMLIPWRDSQELGQLSADCLPAWTHYVNFGHTITSLILITLIILAVRRTLRAY